MAHEFWYGDAESHQAVLNAKAEVRNLMMATSDARDLPELPAMWSREGSVATVKVHGSLINGTAGFMRLWGVTGYDDVRNAAIDAVSDPETKKVLLHVESPGGATNGLSEAADVLTKLGKIKPIHAHSEEIAASAGYWLMCAANTLSANQTAQVGSIGCIATMTSTVRAYEEMGIDKKIVRSGEYKGLGNPAEPISALAEADLQSKVNDLAAMFEAWVAKRRDVSAATVKNDMGQGRVFLGRRALEANLVDKILTYDQVLRMIEKS